MINGFNPVVWNPSPPLFVPMYSAPMPMDTWCPAPPPPDFLYGNTFPQAPNVWGFQAPTIFTGMPLPFFPPPWSLQMPAFPATTFPTLASGPIAAPIQFNPSATGSTSETTTMTLDQKKALLAERETAFKDNQKNWSKSWSSWNTSIMSGIEERRKAEKERAGGA